MEAKELRLGNLITRLDLGDKQPRFESIIELKKEKVHTSGPVTVICNYLDINPIPLTEEWLLKFGFNYQEGKYWIDGLCIHTTDSRYYILQEQGRVFIKNVHQLQNLYFALTGKELTLKEN